MKKLNFKNKINIVLFVFFILIVIFSTSILIENKIEVSNKQQSISNFNSLNDYNKFVEKYSNVYNYGVNPSYNGNLGNLVMMETLSQKKSTPNGLFDNNLNNEISLDYSNLDYSKTNNQVISVDEADIIKTDGKFIYTISNGQVYIILAYPGKNATIKSIINISSNPRSLFVNKDNLIVFSSQYMNNDFLISNIQATILSVYDIKDRKNPKLIHNLTIEGYYDEARFYKNKIYFITSSNLRYNSEYPTPIVLMDNIKKSVPIKNIFYFPIIYDIPILMNLFSFELHSFELESKSFMMESNSKMYMSKKNIYLASNSKYINENEIRMKFFEEELNSFLDVKTKKYITRINEVDEDILNDREKKEKINRVLINFFYTLDSEIQNAIEKKVKEKKDKEIKKFESRTYFDVYKISIDNFDFINKIHLPGSILNQFSMDEYKDIFRIATTVLPWDYSRDKMDNRVYTFDKDMKKLDVIKNIAVGERIYSTRFIGDKIYIVTFKNVDPFFVIDASDPKKLILLGELKIPGFSRYLHPYDNTTLIGIGRDTNEDGRQEGLKISLFDVSDFKNPKEIAKFITEEKFAHSKAEYEHKAFLFSRKKNLLVIPAYSSIWEKGRINEIYNGAMVFYINKSIIKLRGIIDHSKDNLYSSSVERSLYINDMLYTKSIGLLRINNLKNLESVANVTLKVKNKKYEIY